MPSSSARNADERIADSELEGDKLLTEILREVFLNQMKTTGTTKGECVTASLCALNLAHKDFILYEAGFVGRDRQPVTTNAVVRAGRLGHGDRGGRGQVLTRVQQMNLSAEKPRQHIRSTSSNTMGVSARPRAQILTRKQAAAREKTA